LEAEYMRVIEMLNWKSEDFFRMKKKAVHILILSAILAILIEFIAWFAVPPSIADSFIMPDDAENLYPVVEPYIIGYDWSGTTYVANNNDPQLGFLIPEREIKTILIEFEKSLSRDTAIQVYFSVEGEALSEANHVDTVAKAGDRVAAVVLPQNAYAHIRVDINGTFSLGEIFTSVNDPEIKYIRDNPQFNRALIGFFSLLIIFEACYFSNLIRIRVCFGPDWRDFKWKKQIAFITVLCVMGGLIVLQINNSSMECFNAVFPNNMSEASQLTFGTPRPIRSDEFIVGTPAFFHSNLNGQLSEPVFVKDSQSIIVFINNIITLLNPYYWGELWLPASYAFSWRFVVNNAFFIYILYRLFVIITKRRSFSIIAALLILFSPVVQWWSVPIYFALVCGYIVFFYDFFQTESRWKKLIYAWALVCCTSAFAYVIYPAWVIPLVYFYLCVLVGIYATEKSINFKKTDIQYIVPTCLLMLIVVGAYIITSGDAASNMLETVYPGKRFSAGGGLNDIYWGDYLAAPFLPWKVNNMPANQSELSHFLHLFPIPIVLFILRYKEFKKHKAMTALVCFNIFCDWYMVFGIGEHMAKYSLLSYTLPDRLHIIWGFSSFLLLLLESYFITPLKWREQQKSDKIKWLLMNACVVIFLLWFGMKQKALINYIEISNYVYACVTVILLGSLLYFGKKKIFIAILCVLTAVSGAVVNPINLGADMLVETPLAKEIREIDQRDSGRWIGLNDLFTPKYIYAQGVDCLNYLSWPPRFDLFEPLDKEGKFYDIYNRYAHVAVILTTEETTFDLMQADYFVVHLNINDLQKWNVKYVVARGELPARAEDVGFEMLYDDMLDDMNIYKVSYYAE